MDSVYGDSAPAIATVKFFVSEFKGQKVYLENWENNFVNGKQYLL